MTTWILTTGNSDIQLNKDDNWDELYSKVQYDPPLESCHISPPKQDQLSELFPLLARVLGLVYSNQSEYYQDLEFPLLDTFCKYFEREKIELPTKIVVLLTDQSATFSEEQFVNEDCPYWQDTCSLEALFTQYFKKKLEIEPIFITLKPQAGKGLDHWDKTLSLVEKAFDNDQLKNIVQSDELVYVSHQAGTPAISSAVQFVSLGKFQNVNFLVSNLSYNDDYELQSEAEAIASSKYWRGLQLQKAKKLIQDGLPGAALTLLKGIDGVDKKCLDRLETMVNRFNVKNTSPKGQEFEIKAASKRIVDTLDLIEKFFKQENYIQGLALLAAAQETFLKVAVKSEVQKLNNFYKNVHVSKLIQWSDKGLFLKKDRDLISDLKLAKSDNLVCIKIEILEALKFPVDDDNDEQFQFWDKYKQQKSKDINFSLTNRKPDLLKWLVNLKAFNTWKLLEWPFEYKRGYANKYKRGYANKYKRRYANDLRNQLMHNLLGVEEKEVVEYLLGYNPGLIRSFESNKNDDSNPVTAAYTLHVKTPFLEAMKYFGLIQEITTINQLEQDLQKLAEDCILK